jgi:hypothetical protein
VVGNNVEYLAQPGPGELVNESAVSDGTTEFLVELTVVDHVIAVGAALDGLEIR